MRVKFDVGEKVGMLTLIEPFTKDEKGFIRVNFTVIAVELKLFAFLTLKVVTQNHVGA